MHKLLEDFEYITDVPNKIDALIKEASTTRGRKEKNRILAEAQELADAYQEHCEEGGNHTKQFNTIHV